MDDPSKPVAVFVSLRPGQEFPGLDVQLARALGDARARSLEVAHVTGAVVGPLNDARRDQVARLLEQLRAGALPATVAFIGADPVDLPFLGQQARAHGVSIVVGPRNITITTTREETA